MITTRPWTVRVTMANKASPYQQHISGNTIRRKRVLPASEQDLSGYTPQRHFRKLQGRVIQPRGLKSSRAQSLRTEGKEKTGNITPDSEVAKNVGAGDDADTYAAGLPSETEVLGNGESSETRIVLPARQTTVVASSTRPDGGKTKTKVKATEETPRQPLKEIFRNGRRSVLRSALLVPQIRDVAGGAAQWRIRPAQESTTNAWLPPLPAPTVPKPRTIAAKTYKTKVRSMLPEHSQLVKDDGHDEKYDGDGTDVGNKQWKSGYDLEPVTSSFRYSEDSSPLVVSEESRSLEDCLRDGRRASQAPAASQHPNSANDVLSQVAEIGEGLDPDEAEWLDDEQHEGQDEDGDEPKQILDEEPLTEMEIELLDMVDGYDSSCGSSASSSPKRPRSVDRSTYSEGDLQIEGNGNTLEDSDQQQQPVKRRRTERRVPSADIRRTALRELNDRRAAKATRQTYCTSPRVAQKSRKKKPRRSKKQKPTKEPRRLPDHGELMTGPERLEQSDVENAYSPPLELSQDPISQISGDEGEDVARDRRVPMAMIKIPKGFGKVDISLFRMPDNSHRQGPIAQIITYSDGFSGKEREPTGRLMPLKQPSRRKESCQNVTIRYGQLALVSEKPSEKTPQERRRQKRECRTLKKNLSETVVVQPEEDQLLVGEQEEAARDTTFTQNMDSTGAMPQPQTPVHVDQSLLYSTPAGNTSPMKRKSERRLVGSGASQQLLPRAISQRPIAVNFTEGIALPPSTVPMLAKPKTEKQRRNYQIASQEISLVTMKRPNNFTGNEKEPRLLDQVIAGDGCQDPDTRSQDRLTENETYETPSENEEGDERHKASSPGSNLQATHEKLVEKYHGSDAEESLNDPTSDPRGSYKREDDVLKWMQTPSGAQFPLCGSGMIQAQRWEIGNLVAELKEQTKSEKARIREKLHSPLPDHGAKNKYPSKIKRQEPPSSQQLPTLVSIAFEALKIEHQSSQRSQHSTNDLDGSWRPRMPVTSGSNMQVDEEIVGSPKSPHEHERATASRLQSLRRRPSIKSQSLHVVDRLPDNSPHEIPPAITHDSQGGSIVLGDTQNFRRCYPADIPETQLEDDEEEETEVVMVSNGSYFSEASQQLSQPLRASIANRTVSTAVRTRSRVHFDLHQRDDSSGNGLMVGGISMSAAFQHTFSPVKSSPSRQSSQLQTPSRPRTLKELTRSASQGLGTLHGSARKRTVSLPFKPPFKQHPSVRRRS
ncbi:hypothetical protein BKA64DRAFT_738455 [Cadophora sp. MPI-SDFR-AT-0126]|nr:hypothetical protein BKA64DRAFT_738455 [Leotiomycetes sp. MPI-SDFR-AT-0126]